MDEELTGGQAWWDTILARIRDCDALLLVLSPAALDSQACERERRYAAALGKSVLPIMVEQLRSETLPPDLAVIHFLDYTTGSQEAIFRLAGGLAVLPPAPPLPDPLPASPPVPISYLSELSQRIHSAVLTLDEQLSLAARLKTALQRPQERDAAMQLLNKLRQRDDLYYVTARELDQLEAMIPTIREESRDHSHDQIFQKLPRNAKRDPIEGREDYEAAIRGGRYYALEERYDEAVSHFSRAISIQPNSFDGFVGRSLAYIELDRPEEALPDAERAVQLQPDGVVALVARSLAYYGVNRREEALRDAERAVQLEPDNADALSVRSDAYVALERNSEAVQDAKRAMEIKPKSLGPLCSRTATCVIVGERDDALKYANRAMQLFPHSSIASLYRGLAYYALQRHEEALRDADRAVNMRPEQDAMWNLRARVHAAMKSYDKALSDIDRAIQLKGDKQNREARQEILEIMPWWRRLLT